MLRSSLGLAGVRCSAEPLRSVFSRLVGERLGCVENPERQLSTKTGEWRDGGSAIVFAKSPVSCLDNINSLCEGGAAWIGGKYVDTLPLILRNSDSWNGCM